MWVFWLLLLLFGVILCMVAGVVLFLWWAAPRLENHYLFRPGRDIYQTPSAVGLPYQELWIDTPDGCRLNAWRLEPEDAVASVVYFHGSAGNLGWLNEVFTILYNCGFEVLAVDYRGYGRSSGRADERGIEIDAETTARYFEAHLKTPSRPVLYWGRSLGNFAAARAASRVAPDGLILESAFPSKKSMLKDYRQFRAFYIFSRCRLDTLGYLRERRFPVLLVHGDRDRTVPIEQGRLLFEALSEPKRFVTIEGADHINLHRIREDDYRRELLDFLEEVRRWREADVQQADHMALRAHPGL